MSSSHIQITLPTKSTTFVIGDLVHVINSIGDIEESGPVESIERDGWSAYWIQVCNKRYHISRPRDGEAEWYVVHQSVLLNGAPSIHRHLLELASIMMPNIVRKDILSPEEKSTIDKMTETLHSELVAALSNHPELLSRARSIARAHGHHALTKEEVARNRTLQIAKAVRDTY